MKRTSIELMQDTMNSSLGGTHHQQRMALASISSRSAVANVGALQFLREYFYASFQAEAATAAPTPPVVDLTPALAEPAALNCPKCGREFKSQTALNGHGVARCQGAKSGPVLASTS
jgi:hypothetical protein